MKFTFGIISSPASGRFLEEIINSIYDLNIPEFEIIIIGNNNPRALSIPFDENIKKSWITKKKNTITENAKYENVVYAHDYIKFEPDWYEGFLQHGNRFNVCMTKVVSMKGKRYRDWSLCAWAPFLHILGEERKFEKLLPHDEVGFLDLMFIAGNYWVAKKHIMEKCPLDENLCWGEAEDVEWSYRVRKHTKLSMNKYSTVKLLKYKPDDALEDTFTMRPDLLKIMKSLSAEEYKKIIDEADEIYRNHFKKEI